MITKFQIMIIMKGKIALLLLLTGLIALSCGKYPNPGPYAVARKLAPLSFDSLTTAEKLFDNVWWAKGSAGFDGAKPTTNVATANLEVGKLNTKKGGVDILYAGRVLAVAPGQTWARVAMDGKIPIMITDDGGPGKWLSFNNKPSTYYLSAAVTKIPAPFEIWLVFRILPNANYEAYLPSGDNCGYFANSGNNLRIINQNDGILSASTAPSKWVTHIGRMVIQNQTSATLYIDNVSQGTYTFTSGDVNTMFKQHFGVGSITNNADWDFAAMYFKVGNFSITDVNNIYTVLSTKWAQGTLPTNQILVSTVSWTKSGGTYTPSATISNTPTGVSLADPSKWDYQWYWRNNNDNLDIQTPMSTKYQLTTADFPAGYASAPGGFAIKVVVRPKDTNGNIWRWFEGTFANY